MPGVPINDGNDVRAPRYLDLREGKIVSAKSVPYDSAEEAWAALLSTRICEGLRVKVKNSDTGKIQDWEVNEALDALVLRDESSGGSEWIYRGDWDVDTEYAENDVVNNDGSSFIAKVTNTGITPANGYTWGLIAEKGDSGSGFGFELATTYAAISASTSPRLIEVTASEINNNDNSIYLHNGSTIKFLLTIPALS